MVAVPIFRPRGGKSAAVTRRRKFAVALLILTAAVAVFQVATRWTARRTVERHLAAIRAMGYPATLEELEAWYV